MSIRVLRTTSLCRPIAKQGVAIVASLPTILLCATKCCRQPSATIYLRARFCPSAPSRSSFPSYLILPRGTCRRYALFRFRIRGRR